ncbi:MAG: hypothetical protein M3304_07540 [Actinomycetota bacterium]|nr:hypothetical protein [Actinomycetota bacterium]
MRASELPASAISADVADAARGLARWGEERGWRGPDPYEGLNAVRCIGPLVRRPFGRRLITQLVKRSPLDLRPILGIAPRHNPAALAAVVSSYARDGFLFDEERAERLERAVALLDRLRLSGYEEPCWGYPFDVQTRVFFYPVGAPNSIATAFAGQALLDAYEATGKEELLERAAGAGEFFLRRVPQTEDGDGAYFGYLVGDRTPIHNANLLVCGLLARLARHVGREDLHEAAERGVLYTVGRQRPDGSWPYGERPGLGWVDGYHTGYVLEALMVCRDARIAAAGGMELAIGLEFYARRLFLADGTPKFTDRSVFPIDSQCAAQGIQTFALASAADPRYLELGRAIFLYSRRRLWRPDGALVHQRGRLWTNRTPHVRWGAAPMLLALVHLLAAEGRAA